MVSSVLENAEWTGEADVRHDDGENLGANKFGEPW